MTSDEVAARRESARAASGAPRRRTLTEFLDAHRLSVLDVAPGASAGTRRLRVGVPGTRGPAYSISVPRGPAYDDVVRNESLVLEHLAEVLSVGAEPVPATTVPHAVEELAGPASQVALVVTAVPGADVDASPTDGLAAVARWLVEVWHRTSGQATRTLLGQAQLDALLGRARDASRVEDVMLPLLLARQRLAELEVPTTVTHGCLCRRHVHHDGSEVVWVDDWGLGSQGSDPLRDLGRYCAEAVGDALPEVLCDRSELTGPVSEAVGSGLAALSAPEALWPDVVLLAQLEVAAERSARGNPSGIALLKRTVEALLRRPPSRERYPG